MVPFAKYRFCGYIIATSRTVESHTTNQLLVQRIRDMIVLFVIKNKKIGTLLVLQLYRL